MDEFELIDQYIKPTAKPPVLLGKGDDCSVVALSNSDYLIETTDCLVEDIHFRTRDFDLSQLAYKSLAVNISDIAAMGGQPLRAHLNLALPENIKEDDFAGFFHEFYSLADSLGIQLVGGDLSASPGPIFVNLHLAGQVSKDNIRWRHQLAKPGVLCVTGPLGESSAGFYSFENQLQNHKLEEVHRRPPIELAKGQWLGRQSGVQGMMDLSDGLLSDLKRIPSGAIVVDVDKIPMTSDLIAFAAVVEKDPLSWAICGGEDYRLLVNCEQEQVPFLLEQYAAEFAESLYPIGTVGAAPENTLTFFRKGSPFSIPWTAYKHF